MEIRSPRKLLAISATLALAASALAPTAAFARGGPGPGAGVCDGDCDVDQPQAQQQVRARDGSGDRAQTRTRARDTSAQPTSMQARAGGGGQVQARIGASDVNGAGVRNRAAGSGPNSEGNQAKGNGGAGRGWDDDALRGPGTRDDCEVEMGTLSEADVEGLIYMANEEKLAHDVYRQFAELHDLPTFERIADSEARHQVAVRTILERYEIDDPTADLAEGQFSVPELQELYDQFIAQGSAGLDGALAAAVAIEGADIDDLEATMAGLDETAPDVYNMYSHLLTASGHHLAAFQAQR